MDPYIQNNKIVGNNTAEQQVVINKPLDVDIAYGYQSVQVNQQLLTSQQDLFDQIKAKYLKLIANKTLTAVQQLPLASGKVNYKITYTDAATQQLIKFIVYYDPSVKKVLLLNPISLPSPQQFT
jgi:hypothetical protein